MTADSAPATARERELLIAAYQYIYHFVSIGEAEVNGFDAEAWVAETESAIAATPPSETREIERLRAALETLFPAHEGFTEAFDTLVEHGLLTEVPASDAFRDEYDSDTMYVWSWRVSANAEARP